MIKLKIISVLCLICSIMFTIQIFDILQHQGMSFDILVYLGLLMMTLELAFFFQSNHQTHQTQVDFTSNPPHNPTIELEAAENHQTYAFHWTKIGLITAAFSYLVQTLFI